MVPRRGVPSAPSLHPRVSAGVDWLATVALRVFRSELGFFPGGFSALHQSFRLGGSKQSEIVDRRATASVPGSLEGSQVNLPADVTNRTVKILKPRHSSFLLYGPFPPVPKNICAPAGASVSLTSTQSRRAQSWWRSGSEGQTNRTEPNIESLGPAAQTRLVTPNAPGSWFKAGNQFSSHHQNPDQSCIYSKIIS